MPKLRVSTFVTCNVIGTDTVGLGSLEVSQKCLYSLQKFKFLDVSLEFDSQRRRIALVTPGGVEVAGVSTRDRDWQQKLEKMLDEVGRDLERYGLI